MKFTKLTERSKYYIVTFLPLGIFWILLTLINIEFENIVFFVMAYVWHLSLQTPGLRDMVIKSHGKLSFLGLMVKLNYYLQLFINFKNLPFASGIIRSFSPLLFALVINFLGGVGSILFTLLGSFLFEVIYFAYKKWIGKETNLLAHKVDPETHLS